MLQNNLFIREKDKRSSNLILNSTGLKSPDTFLLSKTSKNTDVRANRELISPSGMQTSTYQPLQVAEKMLIVSTSAQDNPTGSGASRVQINYIDTNWDFKVVQYDLDGKSSIETTEFMLRVNNFFVISTGSGSNYGGITANNTGTISLTSKTSSLYMSSILPNEGNSFEPWISVPKSHKIYIRAMYFSCSQNQRGEIRLYSTSMENTSNPLTKVVFSINEFVGYHHTNFGNYFQCPPYTTLFIDALRRSGSGGMEFNVRLELILEKL